MLYNFLRSLNLSLPHFIEKSFISKREICIYTKPEFLIGLLTFIKLHTNTQFKSLIDITAVDFPDREKRFEVVYMLLSVRFNARIKIKVCDLIRVKAALVLLSTAPNNHDTTSRYAHD